MDLILPGKNGFEICEKLKSKERYSSIPIIILSAKVGEEDKVFCLDIGADDYLSKPFSLKELHSRIKAVLRRYSLQDEDSKIIVSNVMEIDLKRHQVMVCGKKVDLTLTEFKILELLSSKIEQVFSRERILDYLWGEEKVVVERTIDVHVWHLREKLEEAGKLIKNVRGIGYKIEEK